MHEYYYIYDYIDIIVLRIELALKEIRTSKRGIYTQKRMLQKVFNAISY